LLKVCHKTNFHYFKT